MEFFYIIFMILCGIYVLNQSKEEPDQNINRKIGWAMISLPVIAICGTLLLLLFTASTFTK